MIKPRTVFSKQDMEAAKVLADKLNLPHAVALLLLRQGVRSENEARAFFSPDFGDLHDPFLMKNMTASVQLVREAMKDNQKIAVFCDYDVDGTSACSILYLYFKKQGIEIQYYTPDRNNDGYGLNALAVKSMVDAGIDLVITVDCGITNIAEVSMLVDAGVSVIVTDHHECGETLPDTEYILNPKQPGCEYPYKSLSGAGIAFKLVQALGGRDAMDVIDYAALGTVADIVPLTGENRVIAKLGLVKMNTTISPGLKLLRRYVLPDNKTIDEYHIGFGFGPRINAAGRMESAHLALDMMLAEKETEKAKKAAAHLDRLNEARKDICDGIVLEAMQQVVKENMLEKPGAIFVKGDWEPGVVGICASRITARFGRPVLVFAEKGDEAVCSARSIEAVNIYDVLNNFSDLFTKFGGHHMAAGLTIDSQNYETLKTKVNAHLAAEYCEEVFEPVTVYDIEIKSKLSDGFAEAVTKLAPYGTDNPKPKLLFRDRAVREKNYFGKTGRSHFKFNLNESGTPLSAVKFFFDTQEDAIVRADVIGSVNISDYTNRPEIFVETMESTDMDEYMKMPAFAYERTLDNLIAVIGDETLEKEAIDMDEVLSHIKERVAQSPFGLALRVEDVCQYHMLSTNRDIKALISKGKLSLKSANEYQVPLNAVVFSERDDLVLKPYRAVLSFSPKEKPDCPGKTKRMIVKALLSLYYERGLRFCVDKADMAAVFGWMKQAAETGQTFADEDTLYAALAKGAGISLEQAVSGTTILSSLELIDYQKSGSIIVKIIKHKEKKELEDAPVYAALLRLK